jgi:hypothetical protein
MGKKGGIHLIVIYYERRGYKSDLEEDGKIEILYADHAILYAIFGLLIERGIRFTVKAEV